MAAPERPKSIAEILGFDGLKRAKGAVLRRYFELNVQSEEDLARLRNHDRILWLVVRFEQEVMNGGIDQFIFNSSGDYALETLDGLRTIDAHSAADWLRRVSELLPSRPAQIQQQRAAQFMSALTVDAAGRRPLLDNVVTGSLDDNLFDLMLRYWTRREEAR